MNKKYHEGLLHEKAEGRKKRKDYGPVPDDAIEPDRTENTDQLWQSIEYDMLYNTEAQQAGQDIVGHMDDRYIKGQTRVVKMERDETRKLYCGYADEQQHLYQISGSWSKRQPEEFTRNEDGSYTFVMTMGENRYEKFHIWQDWNGYAKISPCQQDAPRDVPSFGPAYPEDWTNGQGKEWLVDGRDRVDVPEDQVGMPGDKYLITFRWDPRTLKKLTWQKMEGEVGEYAPGSYFMTGSWTDWEAVEMQPDAEEGDGHFSTEVQMTSLGLDFEIQRDADPQQTVYPLVKSWKDLPVTQETSLAGPDSEKHEHKWKIEDELGAIYRITYYRDPEDCEASAMRLTWDRTGTRPVVEPDPKFYVIGHFNDWGRQGMLRMESADGAFKIFTADVPVQDLALDPSQPERRKIQMGFKVVKHKSFQMVVHPDKEDCTQLMQHQVKIDGQHEGLFWLIGKQGSDKARGGDVFNVRLEFKVDNTVQVAWTKK